MVSRTFFFCLVPRLEDLSVLSESGCSFRCPKVNIIRVMRGNPGYAELSLHPCAPFATGSLGTVTFGRSNERIEQIG